jgi:predicted membrane channel-forming protein YqfA (hemolysin III family)
MEESMSTKHDRTFTEILFMVKLMYLTTVIIWWISCKGYTVNMLGKDEQKWLAVICFYMLAACMNPLANCSYLLWFWFQEF